MVYLSPFAKSDKNINVLFSIVSVPKVVCKVSLKITQLLTVDNVLRKIF